MSRVRQPGSDIQIRRQGPVLRLGPQAPRYSGPGPRKV
jgi:hypothetical protein